MSWPAALEHGKVEENNVNSGIFKGLGDKGIGNAVRHDVLEPFSGDKCVSYCDLKETIAKTCSHVQKTRALEDFVKMLITAQNVVWAVFLGVVAVAI